MGRKFTKEPPKNSELILYQTQDGKSRLEVRFEGETVWLTQLQMAELFLTSVPNINRHLRNIFAEGELLPEATIKESLIVNRKGPARFPGVDQGARKVKAGATGQKENKEAPMNRQVNAIAGRLNPRLPQRRPKEYE